MATSTDGVNWVMANSGEARETGVQADDGISDARYEVPFDAPVRARYVEINPTEFNVSIAFGLRAGLYLEGADYC